VILKNNGYGSDYINANYVDGIHNDSKQAYIATQAPKQDTIDDFWRMCWEQNIHIIVMLTNLEEGGKVKAHQYWPKFGTKQFGSWSVTLSSTRETETYIVRTLELFQGFSGFNKPDPDVEKRTVYQYHYLVWPDMGVPDDASSLLEMMDDINRTSQLKSQETQIKSPLLVHCSAGIGRTGTFVVIDTVIKKFKEEGVRNLDALDLQPILSCMRDQRPGFVQQKVQYYFCYQAVIQAFGGEKVSKDEVPLKLSNQNVPLKASTKKRDRPSVFKRELKD